jgi:hypothetical protein
MGLSNLLEGNSPLEVSMGRLVGSKWVKSRVDLDVVLQRFRVVWLSCIHICGETHNLRDILVRVWSSILLHSIKLEKRNKETLFNECTGATELHIFRLSVPRVGERFLL